MSEEGSGRKPRIQTNMKNGDAICILAKGPRSGKARNGLESCIGPKQAELLSRAFLLDVIAASLKTERSVVYIAYWPPEAGKDFEDLVSLFTSEEQNKKVAQRAGEISLIPQIGQSLTERLVNVTRDLFDNNVRRVLFVCADNPLIDPLILKAAFEFLSDNSVVLGPTFSGGFYLLGLDGYYPEIFNGIKWSPGNVYRQISNKLNAAGLNWQELEISYDIERPGELEQLYCDIDNLRLAGRDDMGYYTEKCLANLKK
jgi:uncharacterized protein